MFKFTCLSVVWLVHQTASWLILIFWLVTYMGWMRVSWFVNWCACYFIDFWLGFGWLVFWLIILLVEPVTVLGWLVAMMQSLICENWIYQSVWQPWHPPPPIDAIYWDFAHSRKERNWNKRLPISFWHSGKKEINFYFLKLFSLSWLCKGCNCIWYSANFKMDANSFYSSRMCETIQIIHTWTPTRKRTILAMKWGYEEWHFLPFEHTNILYLTPSLK